MKKRLGPEHPVMSRLPEFLEFTVRCAETRLLRMGVLEKPLAQMSALSRAGAIAAAYGSSLLRAPLRLLPRKRLTETYLRDPAMKQAAASGEEPVRLVR
jgi:hypothetical protein